MNNQEEIEIRLLKDYLGSASTAAGASDFMQKLALFERQIALCSNQGYSFNARWCEAAVYYLKARHKLQSEGIVEHSLIDTAEKSSGFEGLALAFLASGRSDNRAREAIVFLDQAINVYADDVDFWLMRAFLHESLNNRTAALNDVNYILTHYSNDEDVYLKARKLRDKIEAKGGGETTKSGGCFIATAVYLSAEAPQVTTLRRFRDGFLLRSRLGENFVRCYYQRSPAVAAFLGRSKALRSLVRWLVLDPIVLFVSRIYDAQPTTER